MTSGRRRRWHLRWLATTMIVALALVGCGLSTSDEPEPISQENLPDALETEPPPAQTQPTLPGGMSVTIWLLRKDADGTWLQSVVRQVPAPVSSSGALDPMAWLGPLLDGGPTPEENQGGISTAIPSDAHLISPPERDGDVLVVNLSATFFELRGASSRHAVAQVVYTATQIGGVDEVLFELDGGEVAVTDGEGEAVRGPVDRADYHNLLPPGS